MARKTKFEDERIFKNGRWTKPEEAYYPILMFNRSWLASTATASRKGMAVGVCLTWRAAVTKRDIVTLPTWLLQVFGIGRQAYRESLKAFETVGLVEVFRASGQQPRVRLIGYLRQRKPDLRVVNGDADAD